MSYILRFEKGADGGPTHLLTLLHEYGVALQMSDGNKHYGRIEWVGEIDVPIDGYRHDRMEVAVLSDPDVAHAGRIVGIFPLDEIREVIYQ